jgi:hypothetical protein
MSEDQDWRLRVDLADPAALHAGLRDARRIERELDSVVAADVVVSHNGDTLFAYANTRESIDGARRAIEARLAQGGVAADVDVSRWDGAGARWVDPDAPPADAPAPGSPSDPIVTRTFVESAGRLVRNLVETTVAADARERGVELSIVEHPHLLRTQLAFTLTGPASQVDGVIADIEAGAMRLTRIEFDNMMPLPLP